MAKTINELFRDAVVQDMKAKAHSIPELAANSWVNPMVIRRIVHGTSLNPTLDNLAAILFSLGRDWSWFGKAIAGGYTKDGPRCQWVRQANKESKSSPPKDLKKKPKPKKDHKTAPAKATASNAKKKPSKPSKPKKPSEVKPVKPGPEVAAKPGPEAMAV